VGDPTGFLSNVNLLESVDVHLRENGFPPLSSKMRNRVPTIIASLLNNLFNCKINEKARKCSWYIRTGVRLVDSPSDIPLVFFAKVNPPNFDPFACERIVPYSEIGKGFDASSLTKRSPTKQSRAPLSSPKEKDQERS
jgi:hypothetical protein